VGYVDLRGVNLTGANLTGMNVENSAGASLELYLWYGAVLTDLICPNGRLISNEKCY
jgi:uncharacterized protein YjbI with pentapeptide repeats